MANTKKYVSFDKLGLYNEKIKKVIADGDAAALQSAKDYADSLAKNYDAAGAAATVQGNLNTYIASNDAAVALKADKTALENEVTRAKAAEEANTALINAIKDGAALDSFADIETELAKYQLAGNYSEVGHKHVMADITDLAAAMELKADKTQVATDIAAAVKAETDARVLAVQGVQSAVNELSQAHATDKASIEGRVKVIEDDYLKAADKTELQGKINEVSVVANAAVKQADYDVKVKALEDEDIRIAGLVATEQARAEGVEADLDERLEKVEAFFVGAAEDEGEGESLKNALDTLVEIQNYIDNDGAAADQMVKDIAANKKAIEDHITLVDHNFAAADATLKSELEGQIALKADAKTVSDMDTAYKAADIEIKGRLDVLEAIDHDAYVAADTALENRLNTEIAKKADITALNSAVEALEGADAALLEKVEVLEAKFGEGEGSVEDLIADAKQEAIDAAAGDATSKANKALEDAKAYADAEDAKIEERVGALETASATHALAADLTALAGRVTTAEGEIDTLQSEMDAVEALAAANKAAHEANAAAIALKASQADLQALDARVVTLETWHNNFTEVSEEEINSLFN